MPIYLLKKLAAILLLSIHLYSLGGYLILHQYMSYRADKFYEEQAAKGLYNTSDLEDVEVPVNMPGITDWKGYENISGQIRFGDCSYNYVQMKVTRHTLYLKCVPNYKSTLLNTHNIIHAGSVKDIPVPHKDHVPFISVQHVDLLSSFIFENASFEPPVIMLAPAATRYFEPKTWYHIVTPKQPPRAIC